MNLYKCCFFFVVSLLLPALTAFEQVTPHTDLLTGAASVTLWNPPGGGVLTTVSAEGNPGGFGFALRIVMSSGFDNPTPTGTQTAAGSGGGLAAPIGNVGAFVATFSAQ